jgi:prepilin-type processing-associated H-X9-DG protein
VALLLPAIQAAREAARRTQCTNQVKELALGCTNHEKVAKHFPTGGWGWNWVGDADRGFGQRQPGGWMYNILPYIEENVKHDLPKDGNIDAHLPQQLEGARQMLLDPILIIKCPTRPNQLLDFTVKKGAFANNSAQNPIPPAFPVVGHSDYAANAGDVNIGGGVGGPVGLAVEFHPSLPWLTVSKTGLISQFFPGHDPAVPKHLTGISFQRSAVGVQHVTDGTSKTYLCGEKYLDPRKFGDQGDPDTGNNETWCTGHNNDNFRTTDLPPLQDGTATPDPEVGTIFGSSHNSGFNMAFCDGHVEYIGYDIEPGIHRRNGNRMDRD